MVELPVNRYDPSCDVKFESTNPRAALTTARNDGERHFPRLRDKDNESLMSTIRFNMNTSVANRSLRHSAAIVSPGKGIEIQMDAKESNENESFDDVIQRQLNSADQKSLVSSNHTNHLFDGTNNNNNTNSNSHSHSHSHDNITSFSSKHSNNYLDHAEEKSDDKLSGLEVTSASMMERILSPTYIAKDRSSTFRCSSTSCRIVSVDYESSSEHNPVVLPSPSGVGVKMLIVDDSASIRKMLVRLLRGYCDLIGEASDGQEAINNLISSSSQGISYDIIIIDYQMPNKDGPTATKEIRSLGYIGLIVGVTGVTTSEEVSNFLSSGANRVISKPVDLKILNDIIAGTTKSILS